MSLNAKSIKNKKDLLSDYLICEAIDIAAITETWLTDSDTDAIWSQMDLRRWLPNFCGKQNWYERRWACSNIW